MKKFKDPIAPRSVFPAEKPKDGKNSPWDNQMPCYDQRTSVFIRQGQDYGVGFNVNVGAKDLGSSGPSCPAGFDIMEQPR